jgi:hypothetical protein
VKLQIQKNLFARTYDLANQIGTGSGKELQSNLEHPRDSAELAHQTACFSGSGNVKRDD